MTYALQRDAIVRTRQDLVVVGVRECQNFYAQLVQQHCSSTERMGDAAWSKTSVTVTSDNATAPDGTLTADTCVFNADNDAIDQTPPEAVTSKAFTMSLWLRVPSGSSTITLRLRNAGDTEGTNKQVTVTTTWQRFWLHRLFTAGPVDNVMTRLVRLAGDTINGDIEVWGWNLHRNPGDKNAEIKFPYRKRVAEAVGTVSVNVSRCNISDNGNGARCYYSRPTCQDPDNFNAGNRYELEPRLIGIREYRFCRQNAPLPLPPEDVWPMLTGFPMAAQEIDPERAVTVNERVTFEFEDDASPPLWNPRQQAEGALVNTATGAGTFWRRWSAIYRNYTNPECYVVRKLGYVEAGMTEADFQTRGKYLMLNFEMNDRKASLVCGDRLKLTRKQIPAKISDENRITEIMSSVQTTMLVSDAAEVPEPGDGYTVTIEIDPDGTPEKVNVTARDLATNTLTIQRGRWGTSAVAHGAVANPKLPFRVVAEFGTERAAPSGVPLGKNPIDIIIELYRYAGLGAAEIDSTALNAARDMWLPSTVNTSTGDTSGSLFRRTVTDVTQVETLAREIRDLVMLFLWVNDSQMVTGRLFAPAAPSETYTDVTDDANLIAGSVSVDDNAESRVSRALVAWDLIPDEAGDTPEDFNQVRIELDLDAEEREFFGDDRLKVILSHWIRPTDSATAAYFTSHIINRFRFGARKLAASLEIKDDDIDLGEFIRLTTRHIQDQHGAALPMVAHVVKKRQLSDGRIGIEALDTSFKRYMFWHTAAPADYTSASETEKRYGYWSDPNGFVGSPKEPAYHWA